MSENNIELAKATFQAACEAMDTIGCSYAVSKDGWSFKCNARGEDLPIEVVVHIDPEKMRTRIVSKLPFTVKEEKRIETAVGISMINNMLVNGCFIYNIKTGEVYYRMTNCFCGTKLSKKVFLHQMVSSFNLIDEFNDKLFMLGQNMISLEKFTTLIEEGSEG